MAQFTGTYSFPILDQQPFGLSPSILTTLLALGLVLALALCYALSCFQLAWRSFQYTYLLSYALPALASTATYYLAHQKCASVTALSPSDFPTVALMGSLALAFLLYSCIATGKILREAWQAPSCTRKAFAALLTGALLSSCASHSAVSLLAARWGWESTVAQRPSTAWDAGSASMALVVLGAAPPLGEASALNDASGAAQAWWDAAPAQCTGTFAATAWALRVGTLAAVAWGALARGREKAD